MSATSVIKALTYFSLCLSSSVRQVEKSPTFVRRWEVWFPIFFSTLSPFLYHNSETFLYYKKSITSFALFLLKRKFIQNVWGNLNINVFYCWHWAPFTLFPMQKMKETYIIMLCTLCTGESSFIVTHMYTVTHLQQRSSLSLLPLAYTQTDQKNVYFGFFSLKT